MRATAHTIECPGDQHPVWRRTHLALRTKNDHGVGARLGREMGGQEVGGLLRSRVPAVDVVFELGAGCLSKKGEDHQYGHPPEQDEPAVPVAPGAQPGQRGVARCCFERESVRSGLCADHVRWPSNRVTFFAAKRSGCWEQGRTGAAKSDNPAVLPGAVTFLPRISS